MLLFHAAAKRLLRLGAGVVVLAYAQTQIFEVYYFRMYMALVVGAAAHALVLLPVLLALAGPPPLPARRSSDSNLSLQVMHGVVAYAVPCVSC